MTISVFDLINIKRAMLAAANEKDSLAQTMAEKYPVTASKMREEAKHIRELSEKFWTLADQILETGDNRRITVSF